MNKADPRFRKISFEILIVCFVPLVLFRLGILSMDITNPITLVVLLIMVAEFVRILYVLRQLRKEGVDIDAQGYRSPLVDTVSSDAGNTVAKFNKWRVVFVVVLVVIVLLFRIFS